MKMRPGLAHLKKCSQSFIFVSGFQKGLSEEQHKTSSVKCFPTYVRILPNGQEQGKFLSLDLGGTNFRVIVMELTPHQVSSLLATTFCPNIKVPN